VDALHSHGLGLIVDVVPNHMGIGKVLNTWWRDVLENGPSSRYADVFDIDWHPSKRELDNKVLLPILGDQ
jgi:(1->4)-alpha-D-glucan 1-alpha-D-glucosylmutase